MAASKKVTYTFVTERDTKNYRRFKVVGDELGVIYVKKEDLKGLGNPNVVTVTVTPVNDRAALIAAFEDEGGTVTPEMRAAVRNGQKG